MKATFIRFFRNGIARLVAGLCVLLVFASVFLIVLNMIEGGDASAIWSIASVIATAMPLLFLAVLIEYLSRIADALEKPGALGVNEEGEAP